MVASRRRLIDNEALLLAAERTLHDMEQWTTALTTIITQADAEAEIIRTRPEGVVIPDAGIGRATGPD